MLRRASPKRGVRATCAALSVAAAFLAGCATYAPTAVEQRDQGPRTVQTETGATVRATPPRLANADSLSAPVSPVAGVATVVVAVDAAGAVTEARVVEANPPALQNIAQQTATRLQFSPGLVNGQAAPFRNVPIRLVYAEGRLDAQETETRTELLTGDSIEVVRDVSNATLSATVCVASLGLAC